MVNGPWLGPLEGQGLLRAGSGSGADGALKIPSEAEERTVVAGKDVIRSSCARELYDP